MGRNSGAVCPGLIEAIKIKNPARLMAGNSGAVCPGLIEAIMYIAEPDYLDIGIPGQSAPASLKPK